MKDERLCDPEECVYTIVAVDSERRIKVEFLPNNTETGGIKSYRSSGGGYTEFDFDELHEPIDLPNLFSVYMDRSSEHGDIVIKQY